MAIQSISYTDAYVSPTRVRRSLEQQKFPVASCWAYAPGHPQAPELYVGFKYPVSDERGETALGIIASLQVSAEEYEAEAAEVALAKSGDAKVELVDLVLPNGAKAKVLAGDEPVPKLLSGSQLSERMRRAGGSP